MKERNTVEITQQLLHTLKLATVPEVAEGAGEGVKVRLPDRHMEALEALMEANGGGRIRSDVIRMVMDTGFATLHKEYTRILRTGE